MSIETDLKRLNTQQEQMCAAMHDLTSVMEQTRDLVVELMAWLQEPPSTNLPELLNLLTGAVMEQAEQMRAIGKLLATLPADVARAVSTGEVR